MSRRTPLVVGVLVDLERTPDAGGHVKCWERIAEAAVGDDRVDLTVHFLGRGYSCVELASNVRFVTHAPLFPTSRLGFIEAGPSVTDLAPRHPGVASHLRGCDLVHTTYAWFALSRTALEHSRRTGAPLVTSLHTDVPEYTRVFTEQATHSLLGDGAAARFVAGRLRVPERARAHMRRRLEEYVKQTDWVMASSTEGMALAAGILGHRVSRLRRGIDKSRFHPSHGDRRYIEEQYGIPRDEPLLLYVGRVDASKSPLVLAEAAAIMRGRGVPVHVLFVGGGDQRAQVEQVAGAAAVCAGPLPQEALPRLYASADLFVLPSTTELRPNVVIEAKSSGLPVVLSSEGGARELIHAPEDGVLVDGAEPKRWAAVLERLVEDGSRRAVMARRARAAVESDIPSWRDVLEEDVLPVWRRVTRDVTPAFQASTKRRSRPPS